MLSQIQMNNSKLLVMKINLLLHVPLYDVIVIYTYLFQMCWYAHQTLMLKEFPPFDCLMHNFFYFTLTGYEEIRWTKQNQTEV